MNSSIIFTAEYFHYLSIVTFALFVATATPLVRKKILLLSLAVFPLAFFISRILSIFINNPRPFVVEKIVPLVQHSADNGFPSDHTLLTATIAAVVFVYNKKLGLLLLVIATLVGGARVLAKVHHLTDIFGSIAIAFFSVLISSYFLSKVVSNK